MNEKYPDLQEPQISAYYRNELFPDLKVLGEFRHNPASYPKRHVAPL